MADHLTGRPCAPVSPAQTWPAAHARACGTADGGTTVGLSPGSPESPCPAGPAGLARRAILADDDLVSRIVRLHRDRAKPQVHVFTESGYALTVPAGFRDPRLRVGRDIDEDDIVALRAAGRTHDASVSERRAARAIRDATTPAADTVVAAIERDHRGRVWLRLENGTSLRTGGGDEVFMPPGTFLSAARVTELRGTAERLRIGEMIDRLTQARPRTEREVRERLARRGIEGPALDAAIDRRRGYGVIPDEEFARRFLTRAAARGKSARAATPALRRLVEDPEAISRALDVLDAEAGLAAAARIAGRGLDLADADDRRRFVGRMSRRGWSYCQVRPFFLAADGPDPEDA